MMGRITNAISLPNFTAASLQERTHMETQRKYQIAFLQAVFPYSHLIQAHSTYRL